MAVASIVLVTLLFPQPSGETARSTTTAGPMGKSLSGGFGSNLPLGVMSTDYLLEFSTYFGGSDWEHTRDVAADSQGNVYIVGGTASLDFPTTPGAYDRTFNGGGIQSPDPCDAYVVKFWPNGTMAWSTYLGGPNYDRAYGVEVDDQGYVYVSGRAGVGFPVTPGSFQSTFEGTTDPLSGYAGMQNGFAAKLSPDGSTLLWAGYVGISSLARDIAIDSNGDVYVPMGNDGGGTINATWFTNAFQKTQQGGSDSGILKISGDGSRAIWATWIGGSGDDSGAASVRVDDNGYVYIGTSTYSTDIPTTPGAFDRTQNGAVDFYVAKLSPDGSILEFGTYIGGSGNEWISTHNLAIDKQGNSYVAIPVSSDYPTTPGVFQTTFAGGTTDWGISKFDSTGALVASTFVGGSGQENADGVYVDEAGNVFVTGETPSANFPVTANAFQTVHGGVTDAVVLALSADFSQLLYSTFMGGPNDDKGRDGFMDDHGNLYVAGSSNGAGWPVKNAYQQSYAGGTLDSVLAKFAPVDLPPTITAFEPGGTPGQVYVQGSAIDVRWTTSDDHPLPANPVNISYGDAIGGWMIFGWCEADDGLYTWITSPVPPGIYWLNITIKDSWGHFAYDISNYSFGIVTPNLPPTVAAFEPGGTPGQSYLVGNVISVRWTAGDDRVLPTAPINISYGSVAGGWTIIASMEGNDGFYSWSTPSVLPGTYWINISVFDSSGYFSTDLGNYSFLIISPDGTPPIADAGPDQNVEEGTTVTFDGSLSTDDSGTIANYTWTFTFNATSITLYGVSPGFFFTKSGSYVVTLTVLDPSANSDTDTMTVNVTAADGGGGPDHPAGDVLVQYWWVLLIILIAVVLLTLLLLAKRRKKRQPEDGLRESVK